MKKHHAGIGIVLGGFLVLTLNAQDTASARKHPAVVVGTFDSRAVLMAYVGSDAFKDSMEELYADLARAKAAGDEKRIAELEAFGPELQQRIHRQGFGTAPVDDIIARIADELPAIAAEAGVEVIVSKWALAYRGPTAQFVDVTDLLTAEFDPSAETLQGIREIVAQEPVPLDQLGDH
ncbi:MAG: hypothetical protein E2O39_08740 [Planctomycetota bacterium]|nr:MAG: hypothetical protein E2O39_08740 [Planctomycetota bacterium]